MDKFWNDFIKLYKENPCLWDKRSADYTNEYKKNIAYGFLVEKFWEIDDNADIDMVCKKIASLREEYKKEKERMMKSTKLGLPGEPVWQHYEALQFIDSEEEEVTTSKNTVEEAHVDSAQPGLSPNPPDSTNSGQATAHVQDSPLGKKIPPSPAPADLQKPLTQTAPLLIALPTQSPHLRVTRTPDLVSPNIDNDIQSPSMKRRRTSRSSDVDDLEDDSSTFAVYLKTRMRNLDPQQKIIAQKLISDIMFFAETKQLRMTTSILNLEDQS